MRSNDNRYNKYICPKIEPHHHIKSTCYADPVVTSQDCILLVFQHFQRLRSSGARAVLMAMSTLGQPSSAAGSDPDQTASLNRGFPVLEEHAAGRFDSLTVDPQVVVRQQGRDAPPISSGRPKRPRAVCEAFALLVATGPQWPDRRAIYEIRSHPTRRIRVCCV